MNSYHLSAGSQPPVDTSEQAHPAKRWTPPQIEQAQIPAVALRAQPHAGSFCPEALAAASKGEPSGA